MTLKADAKFREKLIRDLKNDVSNLVNYMQTVKNLKIWTFMSSFCLKHIKI